MGHTFSFIVVAWGFDIHADHKLAASPNRVRSGEVGVLNMS